jgi:oxygen-dependent protoporphyrinogen oxidase
LRGLVRSPKVPKAVSGERVIVVGAGLTGLAVAAWLLAAGREVLLFEQAARPGGQIHTLREPGLVVELGAEGFVARSQAVPALCASLGIEAALVDQLTTDTYSLEAGELVLLPAGEAARRLGFQVPQAELGRGIRSLALGMGQLVDALVERVGGSRLRCEVEVTALRRAGDALQIELSDGRLEAASAVVLAVPARRAARLLAPLGVAESKALESAPLASNVSVNLLYERAQLERYPAGSGLLFPEALSSVGLRALSIVEHKFLGRAPADKSLLRVFFRPEAAALTALRDDEFVQKAASAVQQVLGAGGAPRRSWLSRWVDALPIFTPAHRASASALDTALQRLDIHVAGSAFHGAGIDAAARSAEIVAARLAG